jgi:hypothetical protein
MGSISLGLSTYLFHTGNLFQLDGCQALDYTFVMPFNCLLLTAL